MIQNNLGEIYSLLVAVCWAITALSFEYAGKKVGSLSVNIIRLFIGFLFVGTYCYFTRGLFLPTDATPENWFWLLLSGIIGLVFGDLFLFRAYTIIGSRFAMLIMTLSPPLTAIFGRIILNEQMSSYSLLGMFLAVFGISLAIFGKSDGEKGDNKIKLKLDAKGMLYAFLGAIGQALGLVIGKKGMGDYDPFAATQIRIIAGMVGFVFLVTILKRWGNVGKALKHKQGMKGILSGSFFGPFLGVSLAFVAVKYTETGIASTIIAIVPILLIPTSILIYKQKVTMLEVLGAFISIAGVSMFFI